MYFVRHFLTATKQASLPKRSLLLTIIIMYFEKSHFLDRMMGMPFEFGQLLLFSYQYFL